MVMKDMEETKTEGNKELAPLDKRRLLEEKIRTYVEEPNNFLSGGKNGSEIARALGTSVASTIRNIQLMYYKKEFSPRVIVTIKPRLTFVYTSKV
jgi:hypothetical protein